MIDFEGWVTSLGNQMIENYVLDITNKAKPITDLSQFLDINYKFVTSIIFTTLCV